MRASPKHPDIGARIAEHAARIAGYAANVARAAARPKYRNLDMSAPPKRSHAKRPDGRARKGIAVGIVGTGQRFGSILEAARAMLAEGADVESHAAQTAINRATRDGRPAFGRQWFRADRPGVWWNRNRKAA